MNDHPERSMNKDFYGLIQSGEYLINLMKKSTGLNKRELISMEGYCYYFCAVQANLAMNKKIALSYLFKSINKIGVKFMTVLLGIRVICKR